MIVRLDQLKPGQSARVVQVRSRNAARLERLGAYGLTPGCRVRLEQLHPALIFKVDETEISVDREIAEEILVRPD
jgi:DtxR family Mn-dependent transcriptional regulator